MNRETPGLPHRVRTAAFLVIGNEILTGKVQDENITFLARELFGLGIALRKVVVCPDEIDVIVEELNALRSAHDFVFTSGGVGPTHDDVTIAAVARAFGVRVVQSELMAGLLRDHFKERCTESHLRMANIPEGANLVRSAAVTWPTTMMGNVAIMPGVPAIFRAKFPVLHDRLRGAAFVSKALYTLLEESDIAPLLDEISARFPNVTIGSYPQWIDARYRVKLTFDGRTTAEVDEARTAVEGRIPVDQRVEIELTSA